MDYKYIKQLIEKYWACETTAQEEEILRAFFQNEDVPAELQQYRSLFAYEQSERGVCLDADFDERILAAIHSEEAEQGTLQSVKVVKARHISLRERLRPLYRAASIVAIITLLGVATQHSFDSKKNTADPTQTTLPATATAPTPTLKQGAQTATVDTLSSQDAQTNTPKADNKKDILPNISLPTE